MMMMLTMIMIRLVLGELEGIPVVIMQGRFHSYEGYNLWQVSYLKVQPQQILLMDRAREVLISCESLDFSRASVYSLCY